MDIKEVIEDSTYLRYLADDLEYMNELFEESPLSSAPEQLRHIADNIDGYNKVKH